jgi:hypothetical protein
MAIRDLHSSILLAQERPNLGGFQHLFGHANRKIAVEDDIIEIDIIATYDAIHK